MLELCFGIGHGWSKLWYIERMVTRFNEKYGKYLLLHLRKHHDCYWTQRELKEASHLSESETTFHGKLIQWCGEI